MRLLPSFHRYSMRYSLGWLQAELRRPMRHSLVVELPALHPVMEVLHCLRRLIRRSMRRSLQMKEMKDWLPSCFWILSTFADLARTWRFGSFAASIGCSRLDSFDDVEYFFPGNADRLMGNGLT